MNKLKVEDLHVSVNGKKILSGINLEVNESEIVAIMGPNGSGKSTLANVLMGNDVFKIDKGKIFFNDEDITEMNISERAKKGLFLSFQYPQEVDGVTISNFLRVALNSKREEKISVTDFRKLLEEKCELLQVDKSFIKRYLNKDFSGGEKKRSEILQMAVLEPKIGILDETDSGLDIDAVKIVSQGVNTLRDNTKIGILIITHYYRILNYIKPDKVLVLINGKIVKSGGKELAMEVEENGYKDFLEAS